MDIEPLHRLAVFLTPKFSQLRLMSETDRADTYNDARRRIEAYKQHDARSTTAAGDGALTEGQLPPAKTARTSEPEDTWTEDGWGNSELNSNQDDEVLFILVFCLCSVK